MATPRYIINMLAEKPLQNGPLMHPLYVAAWEQSVSECWVSLCCQLALINALFVLVQVQVPFGCCCRSALKVAQFGTVVAYSNYC